MRAVYHSTEEIVEVGRDLLERLKLSAKAVPLKRSRICLHRNVSEQVHEMVIAFHKDSYVRPHRHINKSESFHVIEGELAVVFFDDEGQVTRKVAMGPLESGKTFFYRLNSGLWHTLIPLSEFVIIHETTGGPFDKSDDNFASWSPPDDMRDDVTLLLNSIMAALNENNLQR